MENSQRNVCYVLLIVGVWWADIVTYASVCEILNIILLQEIMLKEEDDKINDFPILTLFALDVVI